MENEKVPAGADESALLGNTWAVVATVRAPSEMVNVFIAHYLRLGANEIHVFFDDPELTKHDTNLSEDPRLRISVCDDEFWRASDAIYPLMIAGRPDNVEGRQFSNYLRVQRESNCDWILNVDVDELLIACRNVSDILSDSPPNVFMIGARPLEAVYTTPPNLQDLFDTTYFKQPYQGYPKFVEAEFRPELLPNKYGFWGHRRGKGFFRRAETIKTLSCHFPEPLNPALHHRLFHPELELLHFECMTFDLFHEKRIRRITGDSLTTRIHRVTKARLKHFKREFDRGGEKATRELYEHMNVFSGARLARAIKAGFLVERSRFGSPEPKRADFQLRSDRRDAWFVNAVKGIAVAGESDIKVSPSEQQAIRLRIETTKTGYAYLYQLVHGRPYFLIPDGRGNLVVNPGYAFFIPYKIRGQKLVLSVPNSTLPDEALTLQTDGAVISIDAAPPNFSAAALNPSLKLMIPSSPTPTFQSISSDVSKFIESHELRHFKTKIWIYRDRCLVVDFLYRRVGFNFDLTPVPGGAVSLDLVQRRRTDGQYLTPSRTRKRRIAESVSISDALLKLEAAAKEMISRIDSYRDLRTSVRPSAASTTEGTGLGDRRSLTVGVLTLPLNRNFGGNLQAYALMEVIRKLGHSPVLINRRHPPKAPADSPSNQAMFVETYGLDPRLPNASFIDTHLSPISRRFNSSEELASHISAYKLDAIVVGSDQVWRAKYARSILLDFFLGFSSKSSSTIKVSYAASFGADKLAYGDALSEAAQLAKQFDAISVREDSGVALCERYLGVGADHTLDPTLLLAPSDYRLLWRDKHVNPPRGRLVAYVLDATREKESLIRDLAQRLGTDAYATNGLPFSSVDALKSDGGDRSIEAWLAALHDAKFIVTDSYHGVVFSVLFNKPFVAFGNPKRGMARFTSLLKLLGLRDRLVMASGAPDVASLLTPIDWEKVNARLAASRARSLGFLESAFEQGRIRRAPSVEESAPFPNAINHQTPGPMAYIPDSVLCTGCGMCVSESNGSLKMDWDRDGFLVPRFVGGTVPPQAVKVCPFNPAPDPIVQDEDALAKAFLPHASNIDPHAGHFENCYIGYSREFRDTSSSGGVSTYVLEQLLKRGIVDYIYVVQTDGASGYRYQACRSPEDIRSISKTRYYPVSMDELFSTIDRTEGRVAVTGVACFIKAIRLKQHYRSEYRTKIPFLIGIVCGGLKSRHYTDFLAQCTGISGYYTHPEYRVKDHESKASDYSFSAVDSDRNTRTIKMQLVGSNWGAGLFKAKACDFCTDVLTELADISLGDAWLPGYREDGKGHNIVVTRTTLADEIIQTGVERGELDMHAAPVELMIKSQAGGFNHKRNAVKFRKWLADSFNPLPVPPLRDRILRDVTVSDGIVQVLRERTRSKSLVYWRDTLDAKLFRRRMRASRRALKLATSARKDGSNSALAAMLAQRGLGSVSATDTRLKRHPPSRWLLRKLGDRSLILAVLKAALFESGAVERPRRK